MPYKLRKRPRGDEERKISGKLFVGFSIEDDWSHLEEEARRMQQFASRVVDREVVDGDGEGDGRATSAPSSAVSVELGHLPVSFCAPGSR